MVAILHLDVGLGEEAEDLGEQVALMDYVPGLGLQEARDTLNLGLLQTQMMLLECGLAAIIAGTIATCFGELKDAMLRAGSAKDPPPIEYEPKANAG